LEVHDDAWVAQFEKDWRAAGLPDHTLAILEFAEKLTFTPHKMSQDNIRALRRHGYNDTEIHDIVQIAAYFNYINRIADALGVPPEEDVMQPWPRENGDW
jgi:uncharacterized peroxidase-related enzyme